jgi:hypothetical protein
VAFDFPAWLCSGELLPTDFPVVPIQIMDACLCAVLDTRAFQTPLAPQIFSMEDSSLETATWLPGVEKFLPHSWVDESVITDKAVKHDDTDVHTEMWDWRITLLYPWSPATGHWVLSFFCRRLMLQYLRQLLWEFWMFMRFKHDNDWPYQLDALQCRRTGLGRKRPGGPHAGMGRKWQRGGGCWCWCDRDQSTTLLSRRHFTRVTRPTKNCSSWL